VADALTLDEMITVRLPNENAVWHGVALTTAGSPAQS